MITMLNALIGQCICIIISGTELNTRFVDTLREGTIGAFGHTLPGCIISKVTISTLILTLFGHIVTILFPGTGCGARQRYTIPVGATQHHGTLSHTLAGECLSKIIC